MDWRRVEENAAKRIAELMEKFRRLGIDPEKPYAEKLHDALIFNGYEILSDALEKGYQATAEWLAKYFLDKPDYKPVLEELEEKGCPAEAFASALLSAKAEICGEELKSLEKYLKRNAEKYLEAMLIGDSEGVELYWDYAEQNYGEIVKACGLLGSPAKTMESYIAEWFGGWCLALFKGSDEVSEDVQAARKIHDIYELSRALRTKYTSARKPTTSLRLALGKAVKRLKKEVESEDARRLKEGYGSAASFIEDASEFAENMEYLIGMELEEAEVEEASDEDLERLSRILLLDQPSMEQTTLDSFA